MVLAVMAHFFPAPSTSDLYCNKPDEYDRVTSPEVFSSLVPGGLMTELRKTGEHASYLPDFLRAHLFVHESRVVFVRQSHSYDCFQLSIDLTFI